MADGSNIWVCALKHTSMPGMLRVSVGVRNLDDELASANDLDAQPTFKPVGAWPATSKSMGELYVDGLIGELRRDGYPGWYDLDVATLLARLAPRFGDPAVLISQVSASDRQRALDAERNRQIEKSSTLVDRRASRLKDAIAAAKICGWITLGLTVVTTIIWNVAWVLGVVVAAPTAIMALITWDNYRELPTLRERYDEATAMLHRLRT